MSIIWPRLVIKIRFPICFCSLTFLVRNRRRLSSRIFFTLYESKIMFLDCLSARLRFRSNLSGLFVMGDLSSYSTPSSNISAVLTLDSGRNSILYPAIAKISAIRISCGQGRRPPGITILPFRFGLFTPTLYHAIRDAFHKNAYM